MLTDATATGTIENKDALLAALVARAFGRATAFHVVDQVEQRVNAPRASGFDGRVGRRHQPRQQPPAAAGERGVPRRGAAGDRREAPDGGHRNAAERAKAAGARTATVVPGTHSTRREEHATNVNRLTPLQDRNETRPALPVSIRPSVPPGGTRSRRRPRTARRTKTSRT